MVGAAALIAAAAIAVPLRAQDGGSVALGELIAGLGTTARVLVVGAHPDDEDTQLIAFLARARHVETAYLSLTRGDGGQNLIGNELGEALGAIRTEELLAARRIDGAHQFFTRAYDFGFSKTAEETFEHWPKDSILRDVVTVVRAFKPHVIVAVFSGTPRDGHGHHQVSGILAREAYDVAADTVQLRPSATSGHGAWTVTHFYRVQRGNAAEATASFNVGEYSPLLGRSYAEIAGESRSQHKSQGFGALERRGVVMAHVRLEASRVRAVGAQPFFFAIDTTWGRFAGLLAALRRGQALDSLRGAIAEARRLYNPFDPTQMIEPLARALRQVGVICPRSAPVAGAPSPLANTAAPVRPLSERTTCAIPATPTETAATGTMRADLARSMTRLERDLNAGIAMSAGIAIEATASREAWPVGSAIPVDMRVFNRGRRRVTLLAAGDGGRDRVEVWRDGGPRAYPDSSFRIALDSIPAETSRPWWLAIPRRGDMFAPGVDGVADDELLRSGFVFLALSIDSARLGQSMQRVVGSPPTVVERDFGSVMVTVMAPVVRRYADPILGEIERPVVAVPAVSVVLDRSVEYAPAGAAYDRPLQVKLRSSLAEARPVRVSLQLPAGLRADSASRTVTLPADGTGSATFRITGRLAVGTHEIAARAEAPGDSGGPPVTSTIGYDLVEYPHIRPQRLYRDAKVSVRAIDIAAPRGLRVAYIPGVGDNVAPMLGQLGLRVTVVPPSALDSIDLAATDVVVVGPRAYEAHPELIASNARLLDWTRRGGTMVVQYGQYEMTRSGIMPAPITIARPHDRVTEEDAPVRIIDPQSPLLSVPNRITQADFDGWVQERSLYMPRTFDDQYKALLSMNDPNEQPNNGAILVMPYGTGTYVYTSLAFFRQLPAGVPGPARLFMNLIAASQRPRPVVP